VCRPNGTYFYWSSAGLLSLVSPDMVASETNTLHNGSWVVFTAITVETSLVITASVTLTNSSDLTIQKGQNIQIGGCTNLGGTLRLSGVTPSDLQEGYLLWTSQCSNGSFASIQTDADGVAVECLQTRFFGGGLFVFNGCSSGDNNDSPALSAAAIGAVVGGVTVVVVTGIAIVVYAKYFHVEWWVGLKTPLDKKETL